MHSGHPASKLQLAISSERTVARSGLPIFTDKATLSSLANIRARRADPRAQVPSCGALFGARSNVVEVFCVLGGVSQFAVHPRQFVQAGLLLVAGCIHNPGKSR